MRFRSFALVPAALVAAAPAQQQLTAKSFLPDDHRNVVVVDFAALRAKGIWDELEGSVMKAALQQIEKSSGLTLRELARLTLVADPGAGADGDAVYRGMRQVRVVESNAALPLPPGVRDRWPRLEIGGHEVHRGGRDLALRPRPEIYVEGSEEWVLPVLEGDPHQGTPAPDVMSLLAGRTEPLAYFVLDVTGPFLRERALRAALPDAIWPDGEAPAFLCLRLTATGDADDPHLVVEAIVRHPREVEAVSVTATAVEGLRERLAAMPQLRVLGPALATMVTRIDRTDVVCTLDLGRARNAVGHVAALAGLFLLRAEAAPPVPAQPVPAPRAAPAPKKQ